MWPFRPRKEAQPTVDERSPDVLSAVLTGSAQLIAAFSTAEIARLNATVEDRNAERAERERERERRREMRREVANRIPRRGGRFSRATSDCKLCADPFATDISVDDVHVHNSHSN